MRNFKSKNIYQIKKCESYDINQYLSARNRIENINQSFRKKKIDQLEHYLWWFKNKVISYKLIKEKKTLIFFYHYLIILRNKNYLISGWFNSSDSTSIQDIIYALSWQRKISLKKYKAKSWISFVKKDNILAQKYSLKLGWIKMSRNEKIHKDLRNKFNMPKSYVYIRE